MLNARYLLKSSSGDLRLASVEKHGVGCQILETQINRAANRARSVNFSCWNHDTLPRAELEKLAPGQFNLQTSFHYEKKLVCAGMLVPWVLPINDCKAKAARVHAAEYLIPVRLPY